jgi:hypothetical protein
VRRRSFRGTLIHNGVFCQASTICSLAIPLIQSCFQGLSVTEVRCTALFPARFLPTTVTAITMTAVTAAVDPEDRSTFAPSTNSLSENIFAGLSHSHPKARLDIDCSSWQLRNYNLVNLSLRDVVNGLRSLTRSEPPSPALPFRDYTKMMRIFTPAAWMMLRGLFRRMFGLMRF